MAALNKNKKLLLLFLGAFLIRILFACFYRGFEADTACFFSWANMIWERGFSEFYSPDYFCDYPPGYLYILWMLGGLMDLFGLETLSGFSLLLLKAPAILCDMAAGYIIWHFASKSFQPNTALLLSACYLFHPAVLINSSLWGQVDAVYTLLILLVCILLSQRKTIPAYFLFALGILIKPQVLIFSPLILCSLAEDLIHTRSFKKMLSELAWGLAAILTMFALCIPFGLKSVISQYTDTLSSYPYAAVNACNLWGLLGLNWVSQDTRFLFLSVGQIGTISLVITTICSFLLFFAFKKRSDRYYMTGAFLISSVFLFSARMHERYLFPVMLLILFAFLHNKEGIYQLAYWMISMSHFANVYYVLYHYDPSNYDRKSLWILSASFMTLLSGLLFFYALLRSAKGHRFPAIKPPRPFKIAPNVQSSRLTQPFIYKDFLIILSLCIFYGIFAFTNLGITDTPTTECAFPYNTYLELDATDGQISDIYWYLGNDQNINCRLEIRKTPDSEWEYVQDVTLKNVFKWDSLHLATPASSIRLTNISKDANIAELVFTDANQNSISIKQASGYYTLFDEAHTFPGSLSAQTGTYFDEIYYTRTAYEYLHGLPTYENTHPPMGKILIMAGTLLFGTSPFGFRFMGALFGILMLPFIYLLGRNITKNRGIGAFITFIFAFDFMHFAQTRLATIDVFVVFFIIAMYYFMERYCSLSFYDTALKKTWIPLGLCGICFGFCISVKWTGAYAGAGLAILFFLQLYKRYCEYKYALSSPKGQSASIKHAHIIRYFKPYTLKTILFCMIFFVGIPFVIYLLSYIPFVDTSHPGLLEKMVENQINMFHYHSNLDAEHYYSSLWYEWPVMIRPIFYYAQNLGGNLRMGISSFGNPLVWWAGIPAFCFTAYTAVVHKNKTAVFLTISYLAQFLPWILIDRCTFIYHYFPSVPFVVLMLGYSFSFFKKKMTAKSFFLLLTVYALLVFGLFILFYPVLAGTAVSTAYVDTYLRWFDTWVLVLN